MAVLWSRVTLCLVQLPSLYRFLGGLIWPCGVGLGWFWLSILVVCKRRVLVNACEVTAQKEASVAASLFLLLDSPTL